MRKKESGILLAISSLGGDYSIGSLGKPAKIFIDFLAENHFTWWQMLPICQPDKYNSPYNSPSIFSINPYYIDLEILYSKALLRREELEEELEPNKGKCNYAKLRAHRLQTLYKAYQRFIKNSDYTFLFSLNPFLREHCIYESLSFINGSRDWRTWKVKISDQHTVNFWYFLQFEALNQFKELKQYANSKGIKLLGDLPLYTSFYGSEVYFHQKNYLIDKYGNPQYLSGARPDGFSSTGQCWGHPVYNWKNISKNNFLHWQAKLIYSLELFDGLRLDHFRGFESFWAVSPKTRNATKGHFLSGPGVALFCTISGLIHNRVIVGEDLGITAPQVQKLIDDTGIFNMRVLQYCLDRNNEVSLPSNYTTHCIAYTGTHDNHTLITYLGQLSNQNKTKLRNLLHCSSAESLYTGIVRNMYESNANIIIFPFQDVLCLDDAFAMNTHNPSIDNWTFRIKDDMYKSDKVEMFKRLNLETQL